MKYFVEPAQSQDRRSGLMNPRKGGYVMVKIIIRIVVLTGIILWALTKTAS